MFVIDSGLGYFPGVLQDMLSFVDHNTVFFFSQEPRSSKVGTKLIKLEKNELKKSKKRKKK